MDFSIFCKNKGRAPTDGRDICFRNNEFSIQDCKYVIQSSNAICGALQIISFSVISCQLSVYDITTVHPHGRRVRQYLEDDVGC